MIVHFGPYLDFVAFQKTLTSTLANLKRSFSSAFAKEQSDTSGSQSANDHKRE